MIFDMRELTEMLLRCVGVAIWQGYSQLFSAVWGPEWQGRGWRYTSYQTENGGSISQELSWGSTLYARDFLSSDRALVEGI